MQNTISCFGSQMISVTNTVEMVHRTPTFVVHLASPPIAWTPHERHGRARMFIALLMLKGRHSEHRVPILMTLLLMLKGRHCEHRVPMLVTLLLLIRLLRNHRLTPGLQTLPHSLRSKRMLPLKSEVTPEYEMVSSNFASFQWVGCDVLVYRILYRKF